MTDGFTVKNGHVLEKNTLYTQEIDDLIYLLSCAVNATKPDAERVEKMNLEAVYHLPRSIP